ncbi:unnamed protein product [Toxocara canis]|uniref:EB domain-containing protein n=1 Tax=Toxocara canis TaxID=6265 RepID=A0A183UK92_TOXCA|nr:unnamed protein product [Toxocara canis]
MDGKGKEDKDGWWIRPHARFPMMPAFENVSRTKELRVCVSPARPLMDLKNNKPVICRMANGPAVTCPERAYCEMATGFCCKIDFAGQRSRPAIGATCDPNVGCDGNSACVCDRSMSCSCQCPSELGYTADRDGIHCKRVRRRLKEKCKSNFECQAAYSECTSGGCRCRTGFQRDGKGGCKPTAYRCANKQEPLKEGEAIRMCMMQISGSRKKRASISKLDPVTAASKERPTHNCPPGYYCVPVFDIPGRNLVYQGFCCPSPVEQWPVCPVGIAHKSSIAPFFGCDSCPADHFCHRDTVVTNKEICCPKPCVSVDDIYMNGECYPNAHLGESCSFPEQCVAMGNPPNEAPVCVQGMCTCPHGYRAVDGKCKELVCSVGVGGTPSVDANNVLIPCSRSDDCAQGYICDLTINLCCKGNNRCPKGTTEVGQPCFDGSCEQDGDVCHQTKTADQKICCRRDP